MERERDRERESRGVNSLPQDYLSAGLQLSLGVNSSAPSAPESRRKEENNRLADTMISLGNPSAKGRLADGRIGSFVAGEKAEVSAGDNNKSSRRETESISGLDERRSTSATLQYDPRAEAVRAVNNMNLLPEGTSLSLQAPSSSTQNRPFFRQGPSVLQQQRPTFSGLPANPQQNNEGLPKPFSKDLSPKPQEPPPMASPKRPLLEHSLQQTGAQPNPKVGSQRRRTPNVRESKSVMASANSQQQQAMQRQAFHPQTVLSREAKGSILSGSPQQSTMQQPQQGFHQQILDARDNNKGLIPSVSSQQQLHQQQQQALQLHQHQQAYHQLHQQQQALQQQQQQQKQQQQFHQQQQQAFRQQALDSRESKSVLPTRSPQQQHVLQQQALTQGPHQQQVMDARDAQGGIPTGNSPKQGLQQQQQQQQQTLAALHRAALDARDGKTVMPGGSPKQQPVQQQVLHHQGRQQQVLDSRDGKGLPPGSSQHLVLEQHARHQQGLDSRDTKGMISAGTPQHHPSHHQTVVQHPGLYPQVLDGRENKGLMPSGSPQQQQQHQQQASLQQKGMHHQQSLDARESKAAMRAGSPRQQQQQQGLHQQALDGRDSKGVVSSGTPQQQMIQQQQALQQAFEARESKGASRAGHLTHQQQAHHPQVFDMRESKGMAHAGSPKLQPLQQQPLYHQVLDSRDSKSPFQPQSYQQHVLQQQFQQAVSQQPPAQQAPPQALLLPKTYAGGLQNSQSHNNNTELLSTAQHMGGGTLHLRPGGYAGGQPKVEPVELEGTASVDRSSVDRPSPAAERRSPVESTSPKGSVSVAETEEGVELGLKRMKEESRPSLSLGSAAESKDSVRSGSRREGDRESLHPHSQSSGRTSRENMFADLNAEPPASDGEDEGPIPSDVLQMAVQPESSRTTTEEKRKRKKAVKDSAVVKEADEVDNKKASKPAKARARPKGEAIDSALEGDGDNHVNGVPITKDDKIKSLKAGLVQVARRMPKNAHAQFCLGLMHQRSGHLMKAAQAFKQAADVLKQLEEESGQSRRHFLADVQVHQAQCLLQESLSNLGPGKELQNEELESVVAKLKDATLVEAGQAAVWSTLGLLLLRSGRTQNAIYVFLSLLEIVPGHVDTLANLGVAYLHSGELEHATRCFQSVLEKDKTHPAALINYSALLLRQYGSSFSGAGAGAGPGAYGPRVVAATAAQHCLEAALKEDPKAGHIWANLAAAYSTLGNIGQASQCLEQAAKLEPARMSTRYAVAAHRVKDAERSEDGNDQLGWAANEMASILREGDFTSIQSKLAWAGLAMVNRAQHETAAAFEGAGMDLKDVEERALHTLQQAIEEDPEDAVKWHQMGLHTLCTLQFGPAQNYFKTAISRRRSNPSAWSNLGIALQLSEDPSLAEGVYKQALALAPKEQAHSILSNLGNLYRQQRKFAEAHEVFKQALELCPEYAPACNNLGLLLVAEGKWDDAIAAFDRALRSDIYLDAAKSNRMKAVALSQMRLNDATAAAAAAGAATNAPQQAAAMPSEPEAAAATPQPSVVGVNSTPASTSSPPGSNTSTQAAAAVSQKSAHSPPAAAAATSGVESPVQREPFPLPSIS